MAIYKISTYAPPRFKILYPSSIKYHKNFNQELSQETLKNVDSSVTGVGTFQMSTVK